MLHTPPAEELAWTGRPLGGLREDLARKLPHYWSDFRDGLHPKVLGSTLFLYFACLANAIAFGALTGTLTGNQIGIVEMLVATVVGGILFALFAGQPLTLLGGTGPITIFTGLLYTQCQSMEIPFLPVYAWVGVWSGLLLIVCAVTDASALMRYFSRFTDEIFAALISVIFIYEALGKMLHSYDDGEYTRAFLTTILTMLTFVLARNLKSATRWPYLTRGFREFLSDFGPALSIVAATAVALVFPFVDLERPTVPAAIATTVGRPWLVPMQEVSLGVIFACFIPALMATILLFLDQNITVRIVNAKSNRLVKGAGYHLDLLVVGVIVLVASLFGLPWIVAATVHSVSHLRSLADYEVQSLGTTSTEAIARVRENRVSALSIHLLLGVSLFFLGYISQIPMAALYGLFLYMGISSLTGNQFWERLLLWFTDKRLYPQTHYTQHIARAVIHRMTAIQLFCFVVLWLVKSSRFGILFPLVIAALVPMEHFIRRFFEPKDFDLLLTEDPEEALRIHSAD